MEVGAAEARGEGPGQGHTGRWAGTFLWLILPMGGWGSGEAAVRGNTSHHSGPRPHLPRGGGSSGPIPEDGTIRKQKRMGYPAKD